MPVVSICYYMIIRVMQPYEWHGGVLAPEDLRSLYAEFSAIQITDMTAAM